jgi:uncharacterized membrane protein
MAALAACGGDPAGGPPLDPKVAAALDSTVRYEVAIYHSIDGLVGRGTGINNRGWVAGSSDQRDRTRQAVLWRDATPIPLKTLGGPSSSVPWPGINNNGMVVGISQTGEPDSLSEGWSCEEGGFLPATAPRQVCRGFFWEDGVMHPLPTLGGTHGFATAVNNLGQVVGWAETPVHDPTCTGIQQLQFRAVLWEPRNGTRRELPPYPGDSTSAATAINENGQAAGISGDCDQAVGRFSARHAVLWSADGSVSLIPTIGGITWNTPMDLNERGDVTGFANPAGAGDSVGDFLARAFYWQYGSATARDLKTLPGNTVSEGLGISARGQVVGVSFGGPPGPRAFIWELEDEGEPEAVIVNLNDLADLGPNIVLEVAGHINDAGQITGRGRNRTTGERFAFVAVPKD